MCAESQRQEKTDIHGPLEQILVDFCLASFFFWIFIQFFRPADGRPANCKAIT